MQLLLYLSFWLGLIATIECKFSEKQKKTSLEIQTGQKLELEILNPNRTFYVKQFECFNITVAVSDHSQAGNSNYSNVEVRLC